MSTQDWSKQQVARITAPATEGFGQVDTQAQGHAAGVSSRSDAFLPLLAAHAGGVLAADGPIIKVSSPPAHPGPLPLREGEVEERRGAATARDGDGLRARISHASGGGAQRGGGDAESSSPCVGVPVPQGGGREDRECATGDGLETSTGGDDSRADGACSANDGRGSMHDGNGSMDAVDCSTNAVGCLVNAVVCSVNDGSEWMNNGDGSTGDCGCLGGRGFAPDG